MICLPTPAKNKQNSFISIYCDFWNIDVPILQLFPPPLVLFSLHPLSHHCLSSHPVNLFYPTSEESSSPAWISSKALSTEIFRVVWLEDACAVDGAILPMPWGFCLWGSLKKSKGTGWPYTSFTNYYDVVLDKRFFSKYTLIASIVSAGMPYDVGEFPADRIFGRWHSTVHFQPTEYSVAGTQQVKL